MIRLAVKVISSLGFFCFSITGFAQEAISGSEAVANNKVPVRGRLIERGTRLALNEMNVFILPHKLKAITNVNGEFEFLEVPEGDFQFVVSQSGYGKLEINDFASIEQNSPRTLYLERDNYVSFETTIVGQKQKRDQSTKSLKQAEFANLPGAQGDPVKAVQNLPGVSRVNGISSQVVIQGSAPQDTVYDIDGHQVPIIFHFGGLTSVIIPEAVEQVDYLSAGYGAENGRALGGIVSLKTKKPDPTPRKSKSLFFVDSLKLGGLYESQLADGSSISLGGRYSYIGLFLSKVVKSDRIDFTVAPDFADLNFNYFKKLNAEDEVKVTTIFSRDTLGFILKEPAKEDPIFRGNFYHETKFYRVIPQWKRKLDEARTLSLSAGVGQNDILVDLGAIYFKLRSQILSVRGEWDQKISSVWSNQIGFDNVYSQNQVSLKLPVLINEGGINNPFSSGALREISVDGHEANVGLYWRNELTPENSGMTYLPSLRFDSFKETKEKFISPRLASRFKASDSLTWKGATGLYYQPPQPQEVSEYYGNPAVKSPRAIHFTFGFDKDFREDSNRGWILGSSLFSRDFANLVISSSNFESRNGSLVPEVYNNDGKGRAYGIETLLKAEFSPLSGWISYTLSKSTRWDPRNPEYSFQYDQTHNFNVVGAREFGKNWKVSGRFRYVTGNPITPVIGATFDSDNDVYIPSRGPIYSERLRDFSQLDMRFDKKFIVDTEIWSMYLDILNILNSKNPENIRYSYDYSQSQAIEGLPIIPAFGLKGEF